MKKGFYVSILVLLLSNTAFASQYQTKSSVNQSIGASSSKTRAQVKQELIEAQKDGSLKHLNDTVYKGS
jgi:hypothetical protein